MTRNEMNLLIAERCEGLEAIDGQWVKHRDRGGEHGWHDRVRIPNYFTDIAACVRAAEAWRRAMTHKGERYWVFESGLVPEDRPSVRLYWDSGKSMQMSFGDTLEEALASALVGAVK
jgi:hypothetical protein